MSGLEKQEAMTPRFRFKLEPQQALDLLTEMYCREVASRHLKVIMDGNTSASLIAMAEALTAEKPKFGLWLYGLPGNGKTSLMRAFMRAFRYLQHNRHFDFMGEYFRRAELRFITAKDVVGMRKEKPREFNDLCDELILCIDDVGTEPVEVQDFGNVLTPISDLLLHRYAFQRYTVVTSNLAPEFIKDAYKERVADRCREMFATIKFTGSTYRFK